MYEIFLFSGGVYRFDELQEAVEDMGGLVLKKDHFIISRGSSFLSEEIQVILVVPEQDEKIIESLSDDLKGRLDELEMEELKKVDLLTHISVCDALIRSGSWLTAAEIEALIECTCPAQLCQFQGTKACVIDELDETLNKLCTQNILISRKKNDRTEYRLQDTH